MIELVSGISSPQFGEESCECEDQSWFKVQAVLCLVLIDVRCFLVLPGVRVPQLKTSGLHRCERVGGGTICGP
jgi:hypothetical protein